MNKIEYERGIVWIVTHRGGGNAWPPRSCDVARVSGWKVVQQLAHLAHKSPREVATDVIAFDHLHEHGEAQP